MNGDANKIAAVVSWSCVHVVNIYLLPSQLAASQTHRAGSRCVRRQGRQSFKACDHVKQFYINATLPQLVE